MKVLIVGGTGLLSTAITDQLVARDMGFKTTVPLVETFRRQVAWMEKSGKTKRVENEPFEDLLLAACRSGTKPKLPEGMDASPWGNQPTL